MIQPDALKRNEPLVWSPGTGTDVWQMFCAARAGDLESIRRLLNKDAALVRGMHAYRTPLSFAVCENQIQAAVVLLEHGADPLSGLIHDSLLDIARDRGYAGMQQLLEARLASAHGVSPKQRALYELAERHDLMILADEVYERLVFDAPVAPSFARVAGNSDHLVVVNSFSKTYNMTGWRLGWALGSERMIRLMYKAAEFITSNPPAMVQQAGIVALRDGDAYVRELRDHYAKRRMQVSDALRWRQAWRSARTAKATCACALRRSSTHSRKRSADSRTS